MTNKCPVCAGAGNGVFSEDALAALQNYQQADMDGVMVTVSRQALDMAIDALRGKGGV